MTRSVAANCAVISALVALPGAAFAVHPGATASADSCTDSASGIPLPRDAGTCADVLAQEIQWLTAITDGDRATVETILAPDFTHIRSDGTLADRAQEIASVEKPSFTMNPSGQMADRGTVRVWSNGSRLDGFPAIYTESPEHHEGEIDYRQIASFEPFASTTGVTVAATSTTSGADLLVSGPGPNGAEVRKLALARSDPAATSVAPTMIAALPPLPGVGVPAPLGGA